MLRDRDGENLREHLISTAARLLDQRGSAGLAVRDIAREAQVADGALYNYFEDKEDLLAQALLHHVGTVMNETPGMPEAGTGTVAGNLTAFIDGGMESLYRVAPAFAGLMSQPNVLRRFHAMVGGTPRSPRLPARQPRPGDPRPRDPYPHPQQTDPEAGAPAAGRASEPPREPRSLPEILLRYLQAEQRLGRIDTEADLDAASSLIVGAIHGQVLPRVPVRAARQPAPHPARPRGATGHDRPARPGAPGAPPPYLNATALKNV